LRRLAVFRARAEELLDIEWIAQVIYGIYAAISFAILALAMLPLKALLRWTYKTLENLVGIGFIWLVLYYVFLILFITYAYYCV
jgi:hypothetical protein